MQTIYIIWHNEEKTLGWSYLEKESYEKDLSLLLANGHAFVYAQTVMIANEEGMGQ